MLVISLALSCAVLAFATGHLSGGQMNPAVTLGLALTGNLGVAQAVGNMLAQVRCRCSMVTPCMGLNQQPRSELGHFLSSRAI
jgi:glycerol uptake facilitator-like aquaporin